jgi:hypothetical protein
MNINDTVRVRLTKAGLACRDPHEYWSPTELAGYWQLWRLMAVFGRHIHMGLYPPLFEMNDIATPRDIDEDRNRLLDEVRE